MIWLNSEAQRIVEEKFDIGKMKEWYNEHGECEDCSYHDGWGEHEAGIYDNLYFGYIEKNIDVNGSEFETIEIACSENPDECDLTPIMVFRNPEILEK